MSPAPAGPARTHPVSGPQVAGGTPLSSRTVPADGWVAAARELYAGGWWLEALWGGGGAPQEVLALWGRRGELQLLQLAPEDGSFLSLTPVLPSADWFERALRDRTGLVPKGHVDPRPFLFHEAYPAGHTSAAPLPPLAGRVSPDHPFIRHEGSGLFEIPVGPIHAGIIEPGHFRFTTVGEVILDLEVRLNYTHKGTLELARGKPLEHALRLLERLSGDNAAAHACAFAAACEAALGLEPPAEVQRLRSAMVEMERLHCHVADLAGIAVDVAFAAPASHLQALREECLRWNQRLFGHRLLMNAVAIGGTHVAPDPAARDAWRADLPRMRRAFERAVAMMVNHSGLKERVEGTGYLSRSTAELLGCVGPAARASGVDRDARRDAPCLGYGGLDVTVAHRTGGTVSSRMWTRVEEARVTFDLLAGPLAGLEARAGTGEAPRGTGEGLAFVEASRGAVLSWVRVADGLVDAVYQRDPSFLNWRGLEEAVLRNIVPDFPVINKSFSLSYSGSDC